MFFLFSFSENTYLSIKENLINVKNCLYIHICPLHSIVG